MEVSVLPYCQLHLHGWANTNEQGYKELGQKKNDARSRGARLNDFPLANVSS